MSRPNPLPAAALIVALLLPALARPAPAGGPAADPLAALRARQPERVAASRTLLLQQRGGLGLGTDADFTVRTAFTNGDGRTVARFQQNHLGRRVWAGEAIVHVEADGRRQTYTQGVKAGIALQGGPTLTPDRAREIALRDLKPRGALLRPAEVELVAFPTRFSGGIAVRFDPATGGHVFDRELSVPVRPPNAPYVWAYEVRTLLANRLDGHKEISFVVDAGTGAILRKWNAIQSAAPATGTGHSYYRGAVSLSTQQADDGTFALVATDRGSLPQPFVAAQGYQQVGMTTYYGYFDPVAVQGGFLPYEAHASDDWGNGLVLPIAWNPDAWWLWDTLPDGTWVQQGTLTPSGETSAVDAHFGLTHTWDFYRTVYGRDGIDGQGTSTLAVVHYLRGSGLPLWDNAFWSPQMYGMFFGRGTYPDLDPQGTSSLTEMDITAHEMTHGVTSREANFIYDAQSGAINEGTSDYMGKMAQAWVDHAGSQGAQIPEFPVTGNVHDDLTYWVIGANSRPAGGFRSMFKPSLDGWSIDAWYDGCEMIDVHFSSGVFNRAMFFLSQGASSDPAAFTFSEYLPAGMTGVGNHRAAAIWYKALTEYLAPDTDFLAARAGSVKAAQDLYGAGSAEEAAVMRAWAAVNVGSAPGEGPRVRVTFPTTNPPGSFLYNFAVPNGVLSKVQILPTRATVQIAVEVANTSDKALAFSPPTHPSGWQAGEVAADGTWTTPSWPYYAELLAVKATSHADPRQFAKGYALLMEIDSDTDNEVDALDLGEVAMNWGLPQAVHQPAAVAGQYSVDDWDVVFWTQAFQNGYPVR